VKPEKQTPSNPSVSNITSAAGLNNSTLYLGLMRGLCLHVTDTVKLVQLQTKGALRSANFEDSFTLLSVSTKESTLLVLKKTLKGIRDLSACRLTHPVTC
jgi:hypothetical protein